mgnify:CR=1 FL=1
MKTSSGALRHSSAQFSTTVAAGVREIWAHKFRSLLTMLSIILGVSSLVAMSALVSGMEKGAKEALVAIGGLEKVRIEPRDGTTITLKSGTGRFDALQGLGLAPGPCSFCLDPPASSQNCHASLIQPAA